MAARKHKRRKFAHVGSDQTAPDPVPRSAGPTVYRRLRIEAEADPDGNFPLSRSVYLERALTPQGVWVADMLHTCLPIRRVVDLIRWADGLNVRVDYDPPGNMLGYFRDPDSQRQPTLFDIG